MLRIEKLFIQGFKSFNDPTEIVFDKEGITAVVGPNGCGKSNLAESLSWVIGEQKAKALRGGKMEDVIFQGSRNRQPAGMAEVVLTMVVHETFEVRGEADHTETAGLMQAQESLEIAQAAVESTIAEANPDSETQTEEVTNPEALNTETLPEGADSSAVLASTTATATATAPKKKRKALLSSSKVFHEGERITVGRRLYRSGESEYEMNGKSCRLRDVQELFAGTGLGSAHYAIIEQGRIGQVLSAKPMDRRVLIEEAAGISKFKMRQHSAELKLEASRGNLSRVTDILDEIEKRRNSLKRQAARARRYKLLKGESRDLMRAVFVTDYRSMSNKLIDLDSALNEIEAKDQKISGVVAELDVTQSEALVVARSAEDRLNEVRQKKSQTDIETERTRQQHSYLKKQLESLSDRSAQFLRDQVAIEDRKQFIERETVRLHDELNIVEAEINTESEILAETEQGHHLMLDRNADADGKLEEARKKVYESVTHFERWRQLKRQFTDSVDRSESKLSGLNVERTRAAEQEENASLQHTTLSENLEETTLKQHNISAELTETTTQLEELRRTRDSLHTNLTKAQRDNSAAEQRLKSLEELDHKKSYFSEAVQSLMTRGDSAAFKTIGTLADFMQVSPEHETMVESTLRDELQYVVVPTLDDAIRAVEYLKSEGAGRATFLVVDGIEGGGNWNGNVSNGHHPDYQTLDSLLGLRPNFAHAFKLAMPGLAHAKVVDDLSHVTAMSAHANGHGVASGSDMQSQHSDHHVEPLAFMTVAKTGERITAGRLITGGSKSEKGLGVLALKREIAELTDTVESLSSNQELLEQQLAEIKSRIFELEDTRKRLDSELRQIDKQTAVLREQIGQRERERERAANHLRVVERELVAAEVELKEFEIKLQQATEQTEIAEAQKIENEKVVEVAVSEVQELRRIAEQRSQELSRKRAEFAAKTERRRGHQNDLRRLDNETSDLNDRLSRLTMEAAQAKEQASSIEETIREAGVQLETLLEQQAIVNAELDEHSIIMLSAREKLEGIEIELRSTRDEFSRVRDDKSSKQIEKAGLTSNLEHVIQSCHSELAENIVEICERLDLMATQSVEGDGETPALTPIKIESSQLDEDIELDDFIGDTDDTSSDISFWNVPQDFDVDGAKSRLSELRNKIDNLGPINMMALEELTEVEDRYNFLSTQKRDIEKAIADTQAAIFEIKKRSRDRFAEAFHIINENFKAMFQELFGGGKGEMRLIDETDILESGIEIIAQPPGKRLQNVLLLSGGEKAMAALSLVLAIFKYRPSPFCLLDEVDAPLDEMNITRFADKVLEMSAHTQFMVITHSKRTMEAAGTLYGVTMEDPGVSKMVSVKMT